MKKFFILFAALLVATSAFATEIGDTVVLDLTKPTAPADSFAFAGKKYWSETYGENYSYFECSPFLISHLVNGGSGGSYWDGFTVCKSNDVYDYGTPGSSTTWIANQWNNIAGGGIKTDASGRVVKTSTGAVVVDAAAPYLVGYWGYYGSGEQTNQIKFNDDKAYEPIGVYVTNSTWPFYGCIHGDGFARAFVDGDSFKLIAHGVAADKTEKTIDIDLISCSDGYFKAIRNWKFVDLSALGKVTSVYFTMTSTDASQYGNNTAVYFCIDKFMIKKNTSTAVSSTDVTASTITYNRADDAVVLSGNDFAVIYDGQGKQVIASKGPRIDTRSLGNGLYVVKTAKAVKKFVK